MSRDSVCFVALDHLGAIQVVNAAWRRCERSPWIGKAFQVGDNYLERCEQNTGEHSAVGRALAKGARAVLAGEREEFRLDYSTPSPKGDRWFEAQVVPTRRGDTMGIVVFHKDITNRKLAEQRVVPLARTPLRPTSAAIHAASAPEQQPSQEVSALVYEKHDQLRKQNERAFAYLQMLAAGRCESREQERSLAAKALECIEEMRQLLESLGKALPPRE
jgi:hypothetical protein